MFDQNNHPENQPDLEDTPEILMKEAIFQASFTSYTFPVKEVYDVITKTTHLIAQLKIYCASPQEEERISQLYAVRDHLSDKYLKLVERFNEALDTIGLENGNG